MSERVAVTDFTLADSPIGGPVPEFGWLPAVVPGGVHESLLAAGRIEHPYRDRHETDARWIEDRDWWYRATLRLPDDLDPGERLRLVCHGLDTVVDLWLDDTALGHHENMFRPAEFDLSASRRAHPAAALLASAGRDHRAAHHTGHAGPDRRHLRRTGARTGRPIGRR